MPKWECPKIWPDSTVFVIGGGFSLYQDAGGKDYKSNDGYKVVGDYLGRLLDGYRVIGVNEAYKLGSFVDVVWFGDRKWWDWNRKYLLEWNGLKCSCHDQFSDRRHPRTDIKFLKRDEGKRGITKNPKEVCWNKNSGVSAINLAYHLGAKRVVLLGFDMKLGPNAETHWHTTYFDKMKPIGLAKELKYVPDRALKRFLTPLSTVSKEADRLGLQIWNACPASIITEFVKIPLMDIISLLKMGDIIVDAMYADLKSKLKFQEREVLPKKRVKRAVRRKRVSAKEALQQGV